jgi:hypothetical protein
MGYSQTKSKFNPYDQEHVDFVTAIRRNQPINETEHVAHAKLTAVMGRTAAYTGQEVTWEAMMDSEEHLGPTEYAMGPVPIKAVVSVPGNGENMTKHMRS